MKKLIIVLVVFAVYISDLQGQESTTTSGGEATGEGGSVSYSVGQLTYSTHSGTSGSVSEGVQQPYEVYLVSGVEEAGISLKITTYPNPVVDRLTLKFDQETFQREGRWTASLHDVSGAMIKQEVVIDLETAIEMADLSPAVYFLRINGSDQDIKTFKIIKK